MTLRLSPQSTDPLKEVARMALIAPYRADPETLEDIIIFAFDQLAYVRTETEVGALLVTLANRTEMF